MAIVQLRAPDQIPLPSGGHRTAVPAGSEPSPVGGGPRAAAALQRAPPRSPVLGQAAGNRRSAQTHTPGDRHGAAAHRYRPAAADGDMATAQQRAPDQIPLPSGGHRTAGTRRIGAVTGWWGPSSCCSTAASSPPRSPVPRARPPATAAVPPPHTPGERNGAAAHRGHPVAAPGDMAIVQQRAPGSDLAPPGRPQACRHPPDRCRHRLVVGALELLQHCSELPLDHPVPGPGRRQPPPSPRPTLQVIATAWPRIEATLQRPQGDMAIIQQRASGSDLAPPGGHRPAGARQIGAVTGWWWGPSSCCSTAASSPLAHRSPGPGRQQPPPHTSGDRHGAAAHRGHPAAAPGGHDHHSAARLRIRSRTTRPATGQLVTSGSGPSPVGGGALELLQHCSELPLDHPVLGPGRRQPPPSPPPHTPGDRHGVAAHRGHPAAAPGGHDRRPAARLRIRSRTGRPLASW